LTEFDVPIDGHPAPTGFTTSTGKLPVSPVVREPLTVADNWVTVTNEVITFVPLNRTAEAAQNPPPLIVMKNVEPATGVAGFVRTEAITGGGSD
jgi:hypothetical protein